jgi:hypothetical protein
LEDRLPRRLIAMLFGYPLVATAVAIDSVWTLFHRGWWPAAAYTLAIAAIACALAAYSEHVLDLPPAIHVLAVGTALIMSNAAMIMATGEVSRHGRYPGGDAALAVLFSFTSLTVTTLICHLGETLAEHLHSRDLPASDLHHSWSGSYNAATLPTPDLMQPTLIDADGGRGALRGIGQFQRTDHHPMTARHQLDHGWEAILHQLTGLYADGQNTMEAADAVRANQVQTERLPFSYAVQPDSYHPPTQPWPLRLVPAPTRSDVQADVCG